MTKGKLLMMLSLILALVIVFGCTSGPSGPAAKPAEQPAVEKGVIKVGILLPLTLAGSDLCGIAARDVANEINSAGGIKAGNKVYTIEIAEINTNEFGSVPDAVAAAEKAATIDKCNVFMGGMRSDAVVAQMEVMADNKIIYMGTGVTLKTLNQMVKKNYERYKYWFRFWPPASEQLSPWFIGTAEPVIKAVRSELGIEKPKIALLSEKAAWCDAVHNDALAVFPKMGCEVVGEWRPSIASTDVSTELNAIKNAGAQIMFATTAYPVGLTIIKQWGDLKIPVATMSWNSMATISTLWKATAGSCQYYGTTNWIARIPITDQTIPHWDKMLALSEKESKNGRQVATAATIAAHDNIMILKEAIERAGTFEDKDALVKELERTDYKKAILGRIALNPLTSDDPHGCIWGPGYVTGIGSQWVAEDPNTLAVSWPTGDDLDPAIKALNKYEGSFAGIKYPNTQPYKLPPWMVDYWKAKK